MARSRSGCLNCKRRKRKCDEERPGCQACGRRGIQCEGYATPLRWAGGIAVRGRFAGVSIPDGTARANKQPAAMAAAAATAGQLALTQPARSRDAPVEHKHPRLDSADASTSSPSSAAWGSISSPSDLSSPSTDGPVLNSGLRRLYTTETTCWIQPHFEAMALQSPALVRISAAIQAYLDDGQDGPSVQSMEHVDLALQTFRLELASHRETMHAATLSAGLLLCTLRPEDAAAVARTCRMNSPIGIWKLLRKLQDTLKDGRLGGVEIVSGLPRSLLDIFASIFDNDDEYTENRFWTWPGEIGEYLQCHLWDCWRFSGILEVRRRKRMEQKRRGSGSNHERGDGATSAAPATELILCRLIASMDALNRAFELPRNEHLLVHNGLMYPMVTASLEVELLKQHHEWRNTLHEVRMAFLRRDSFKLVKVTFGMLDDAWEHGTSDFDVHEAAKIKGVEIAVF
ncbi:hypothetical protein G7Z17_g7275 [Cylindrodendrum hubeiense]|uniref:Zn(2)-C6 fungal-type domain-containing protein n=1 Tax=Cylindrodendrum hubeiense TaxID=595255 RepID=A0A9P5LFX9_9HYPO|nr:hypothetical protein G7Z17_g7275 [Cylindrodendrum hubeiense]